jgi:hypothetical protein
MAQSIISELVVVAKDVMALVDILERNNVELPYFVKMTLPSLKVAAAEAISKTLGGG